MKRKAVISILICTVFLLASCGQGGGKYLPKSFADMNLEHVQTDGFVIDNYRDVYVGYPFFSNKQDSVTYVANAMYDVFTLANKWYVNNTGEGEQIVHRFGGTTPKYFEWMAQKAFWTNDIELKNYIKDTIKNYPIMASGQFWTWHFSPRWPVSATAQNGSFHYDDQFRFVSSIKQILAWEQSIEFLDSVDTTLYTSDVDDSGNPIPAAEADVSINMTVRQKMDLAVNFILEQLNGKNGLIILPGENTGRRASKSSNYFDSYCYGNKSAYENQLFYHMLGDLIDIETMMMNHYTANGQSNLAADKADIIEYYKGLMQTVQENYVREFWDSQKKRFIATIDVDGVRWDFGMVTQNLEEIVYGVAPQYDKDIMDWINGTRIIQGDTSTGADIYEHKIAPRTNTLKIETSQIREDGQWKYWWHGMPEIHPGHNQRWNESQVNGGILFWTSYYDLMSRFKVFGPENAMNRFKAIADEYEIDLLFRDPANALGCKWKLGVIGEFPESGLVPLAYLNGLLGIDALIDGLRISPMLPEAYTYAGVDNLVFGGNTYKITVYKNGELLIEAKNPIRTSFSYFPQSGERFEAVFYDGQGNTISSRSVNVFRNRAIIDTEDLMSCKKIKLIIK